MLAMSSERAGIKSDGFSGEVEITPEMIEAGLRALYTFRITEPDEDEMRSAVAEVFKMMLEAQPECRHEAAKHP